jgi:6-phosphofructokinase 1
MLKEGKPIARSRLLASLFAEEAVQLISQGVGNRVVGLQKGEITNISLEESCKNQKSLDVQLLRLAKTLAT